MVRDNPIDGAVWREVVATAAKSQQLPSAIARFPADTPKSGAVSPLGWDPYHVWLTRVRQPHEQRARLRGSSSALPR